MRPVLFVLLMVSVFCLHGQEITRDTELPLLEADSAYTLGAGDRLRISVFNQDDLTGDYVLDGKGRFSMPLIGAVRAQGLTPAQLEKILVSKLKPDYLVNPRVYVQVVNYRPYYLMGEVNSTGAFPYVAGMTYLKAIAIAGGFSYRAKEDRVFVIRCRRGFSACEDR